MDVAADTAPILASSKAAAADTDRMATSATVQKLVTEESHLLAPHLCGPDTAQTIALTKVLLAKSCSVDVTVMVAVADLAAVDAVLTKDALAIQVVDADVELPLAVVVADLRS